MISCGVVTSCEVVELSLQPFHPGLQRTHVDSGRIELSLQCTHPSIALGRETTRLGMHLWSSSHVARLGVLRYRCANFQRDIRLATTCSLLLQEVWLTMIMSDLL